MYLGGGADLRLAVACIRAVLPWSQTARLLSHVTGHPSPQLRNYNNSDIMKMSAMVIDSHPIRIHGRVFRMPQIRYHSGPRIDCLCILKRLLSMLTWIRITALPANISLIGYSGSAFETCRYLGMLVTSWARAVAKWLPRTSVNAYKGGRFATAHRLQLPCLYAIFMPLF